jgi:hypothetical protein
MPSQRLLRLCYAFFVFVAAGRGYAQTTITWGGAASGSWFTGASWSPGTAPNSATHDAVISTGGVSLTTAGTSNSLTLHSLTVSGANANVLFDFSSSSLGLTLGSAASSLSAGLTEFRTTAGLSGSGAGSTTLGIASGAELLFSTATNTRGLSNLTLNNSGTLHVTSGILSLGAMTLNNQSGGLVYADGGEIALQSGVTLANSGTLRANGSTGILRFNGTFTTANLGTVDLVNGGRALIQGTINNASATLAQPGSGSYELLGGTINNGTVASGALTFTSSGGVLNGVSLASALALGNSTGVYLRGGTTLGGSTASLGNNSFLYWQQSGTLAGKALTFGTNSYIYVSNASSALTLDSASTATGQVQIYSDGSSGTAITNQGQITHTTGTGNLYAASFANSGSISNTAANNSLFIGNTNSSYNTTNTGNITVNGSGSSTYLDGNFDNTGGTLTATQGQFYFRGANTTAHLNSGTLDIASGAHAYLQGTLNNASTTLNAPHTGSYELSGGTITGGTIASGALTFTGSGGYLDATTYTGDLSLPTSSYVRFLNGTSFTGANATFASNSGIYWQQAATLTGKALTFGSGSYIYVNGANNTLTLGASTTGTGEIDLTTDGNSGTAITNQGTLNHTSGYGQIYAPTFINTGSITNTSPNTYLVLGNTSSGYNTTNTGTITVNGSGSSIYLDGNFDNTGGTLTATQGQFYFRGANTTAHLNGGTIDIASGAHAYLQGTLNNASTTLNAPHTGSYELSGGTITGGTIASGALTFTGSGGYLDATTYTGDLSLPASSYVRFTNGTTFTGANATFASNSGIYWQQAAALTGKALTFGSGSYIYANGANNTLTLGASTTGTGEIDLTTDGSSGAAITNQGTLNHNSGYGQIYAPTFANSGSITNTSPNTYLVLGNTSSGYNTNNTGTITVNGSGSTIYLDGNFDNTGGTLTATQGQFYFRGANSTAHLNGGTLDIASGAHAYLQGTLNNASTTLNAPHTGSYELSGGTIAGGSIASGALTFTGGGGTLNGVSLAGTVALPASSYVTFTGGTNLAGSAATLGNNSGIYWQQAATLAGKALTFGSGSYLYVSNTNSALTLDNASSATGQVQIYSDGNNGTAITNQGQINHTSGTGYLYARSFANSGSITNTAANNTLVIGSTSSGYDTTNTGNITVNGAGANIYLDGNFDNTGGTLTATQGQFYFHGNSTTAHLNGGTIDIASGAHAYLNGTIDNASATLNAPRTGAYELYGGTINNGTIASGALTFTGYGGKLDGVTVNGNLTLPNSAGVTLSSLTRFTGATATLGTNAYLYWQQSDTLISKGLVFGANSLLYLTGINSALTIDSNSTATGQVDIYADGSAGTAITNQGVVTHTSNTGYLYANTLANSGTIAATSGTLYLGSTLAGATIANNSGATIRANGGNIVLQTPAAAPLVNNGTIDVQNGTFFTGNHLTNGTGLLSGAGTFNGNVVFAGGTLAPGNSGIGALNFANGTFTVTSPGVFAVELGGATSDQLVFANPTSMIDIGSGLLTLSLTLTAPPTASSYNLIRISSGGSGITGTFAGLPNTGDSFLSTFGSNSYSFAVNYQPNTISLTFTPVPEPATWALLGSGLLLTLVHRRRRRS